MKANVVLGLIGSLVILLVLFEMLRRQRLREKYAVLWFLVAVASIVIALVPQLLNGMAELLGVAVPANLLFFLASMTLMVITLQHSQELSLLEEKTRTLAEEVALLRLASPERPSSVADATSGAGPDDEESRGRDANPGTGTAPRP